MPNPVDDEEIYDAIVLAGERSPGVVRRISGHDRAIGWDVKKGSGQTGATTTRSSEDPIEFTVEWYLVAGEVDGVNEFDAWDEFATVITSSVSGPTPKALDIYQPDLAANDIASVVLKKFGGLVHDGKGGATVVVTFLEYKPPKPKGGTPKGAVAKAKGVDPNQAALDELSRLTDQYARTPWG